VIDISPPGRGQIISHNLYEPEELERLKSRFAGGVEQHERSEAPRAAVPSGHDAPTGNPLVSRESNDELRSLRAEIAELRHELESLLEKVRRQDDAISNLRSSLDG
jgi:hypothetical protein